MVKGLIVLFLGSCIASTSYGQMTWGLDSCFGTNGTTITDLGHVWEPGMSIALQEDGKLVGAAASMTNGVVDFAVIRYDTLGFLDESFGEGGIFRLSGGNSQELILQDDQKIIVSGQFGGFPASSSYALLRLTEQGELDSTFGENGMVSTNVGAFSYRSLGTIVQTDGKIVQSGTLRNVITKFTLARYESDGSVDTTFGDNGMVIETQPDFGESWGLLIQPDGKLVTSGRLRNVSSMDFFLKRYHSDGSVDSTFGMNGTVLTDIGNDDDAASSVHLLFDGKFLMTGRVDYHNPERDFWLLKYNADGSLDETFGTGGMVSTDFGYDEISSHLIPLSNGQIIVAGWIHGFNNFVNIGIAKYNSDGSLDTQFGIGGKVITSVGDKSSYYNAGIEQEDGKIVFFGMADTGLSSSNMDVSISRYAYNGCPRTGVIEPEEVTLVRFYPNPTSQYMHVECSAGMEGEQISLTITNTHGQRIRELRLSSSKSVVDLNGLSSGLYLCTYSVGAKSGRVKLMVE